MLIFLHARNNLCGYRVVGFDVALALTVRALGGIANTRSAAGVARLLRLKHHGTHLLHDGAHAAPVAVPALAARLLARSALDLALEVHVEFEPVVKVLETQTHVRLTAGSLATCALPHRGTAGRAAAGHSAKHAGKNVGERETSVLLLLLVSVNRPGLVVDLPARVVGQHFVRLLDAFKNFGVAALVGVVLARHLHVRLLDLVRARLF